jgi:hypothetical protein
MYVTFVLSQGKKNKVHTETSFQFVDPHAMILPLTKINFVAKRMRTLSALIALCTNSESSSRLRLYASTQVIKENLSRGTNLHPLMSE